MTEPLEYLYNHSLFLMSFYTYDTRVRIVFNDCLFGIYTYIHVPIKDPPLFPFERDVCNKKGFYKRI